jgi:hypothetical protein
MANPLPPGAIPKLYRLRNKDGKEIGAWYVKIKKAPVNLKTQDYMKARERAKDAVNGVRSFVDDRYFDEAQKTDDNQPANPHSPQTPHVEPIQSTAQGDWTSDAVRAATATETPAEPETVKADKYYPPGLPPMSEVPPTDAPKEPGSEKAGIGDETTTLPPEMMNGLVTQIAQTLVELQIQGQEYLAIRWGKFQPGAVSPDSKARELPQKIWEEQIRKWIPTDVPLPAWVVAPVLCAMLTVPIQLEGATPIPKKEKPQPS